MRRADTWTSGEGYWGHKMDALLGQYLTPLVMLTDGPEETRAIARELRKAMLRRRSTTWWRGSGLWTICCRRIRPSASAKSNASARS
jgi:hypothetical protein